MTSESNIDMEGGVWEMERTAWEMEREMKGGNWAMKLNDWEKAAVKEQNDFKTIYNRVFQFELTHKLDEIKTIIGIGLFGFPELNVDLEFTQNCHTCYKDDEKKIIDLITNALVSEHGRYLKSSGLSKTRDHFYPFEQKFIYLTNTYLICKLQDSEETKCSNEETTSAEKRWISNEKQNDKDSKKKNEIRSNDLDNTVTVCIYGFSFDNEHFKFVDIHARIYQHWEDFTKNNLIPPCKYCFPNGGIYKIDSKVLFEYSPSSKMVRKLTNCADVIGSTAAVTTAVATLFVTSPLIMPVALGVSIVAGAYGAVRSISQLIDRSEHKQSISLKDAESRNHWLNITAASFTAGTGAVLAKSSTLVGKFGVSAANGIKVLNGITVCIDVATFGNNMYNVYKKMNSGESLDLQDYFDICLQLMFLTGAIRNARQLHKEMSQVGNVNNVNKTLTKSQKNNARKKRALARARQDPNYVNPKPCRRNKSKKLKVRTIESINVSVQQISTKNNFVFVPFLQRCPQVMFPILRAMCTRAELIWNIFESIRSNFCEYKKGQLDMLNFLNRTCQHMHNLYAILKEEVEKLRKILSSAKIVWSALKLFQTENQKDNMFITLDNAVTKINNLEADIKENKGTIELASCVEEAKDFELDNAVTNINTLEASINENHSTGCLEKANNCEIIDQIENSVKKGLSQMIYKLSENICAICLAVGVNLINSEITEIYKYVMTDVIDLIVLDLSFRDSQFDKNKKLFGNEIAVMLKLNEENIIFNDTLQKIITNIRDYVHSYICKVISARAECYYPNVIQPDILHSTFMKLPAVLIKMLNLVVKINSIEIFYKHELILLQELLTEVGTKVSSVSYSGNLIVLEDVKILSEILQRLQNDVKFDNEYYSAYIVNTVQMNAPLLSTTCEEYNVDSFYNVDEELPKHKLIFILSHKLFMKLMESGFEMNQENTTQIFDIVINFIKNKFIREIEDAYEKISVITNKENIFYIITDKLIKKCLSDDLLLAECADFCMEQLVFVEDTPVWEDIIKEGGMEAYWYCDMTRVNDYKVVQKLEKKFNVMLCKVVDLNDLMLILKPSEGYSGNLKLIISCKVSKERGCFVICLKDIDHNTIFSDSDTDDDDEECFVSEM